MSSGRRIPRADGPLPVRDEPRRRPGAIASTRNFRVEILAKAADPSAVLVAILAAD